MSRISRMIEQQGDLLKERCFRYQYRLEVINGNTEGIRYELKIGKERIPLTILFSWIANDKIRWFYE